MTEVQKAVGGQKIGLHLYEMCRGIDNREIRSDVMRKSVSCDVNYGIRMSTEAEAKKFLTELAAEVSNRLKNFKLRGSSVTLKLMIRRPDANVNPMKFGGHGICDSVNRSKQLNFHTWDSNEIAAAAWDLLKSLKPVISDLRGIGITITKLEPSSTEKPEAKSRSILNFAKPQETLESAQPEFSGFAQESEFSELNDAAIFQPNAASTPIVAKPLIKQVIGKKQQSPVRRKLKGKEAPKLRRNLYKEKIQLSLNRFRTDPVKQQKEPTKKPILPPVETAIIEKTTDEFLIPKLCGLADYDEVKMLIKEWVREQKIPSTEDIKILREYFVELIISRNLDRMDSLYRLLLLCTKIYQRNEWKAPLTLMLDELQELIQNFYGLRLKTEDDALN